MTNIIRTSLAAALVAALSIGSLAAGPALAQTAPATQAADVTIRQVSEATFAQEVLGFDGVVIIELYADWCGPCKVYAPIVHAVAAEYKDNPHVKFLKLDGDGSPKLVQKLGASAFPTTFFFKKDDNGDWRLGTQQAVLPQDKLKAIVDRLVAGKLPLPTKYE